ncbi:hypothetical protein ACB098_11G064600 [Castanea mollissima]
MEHRSIRIQRHPIKQFYQLHKALAFVESRREVFEEVLEIVSYMTFFSPTISMDMWSLAPLMMEALADFASDYFPNILVPLDNYVCRGTAHFLPCKEPDYQQSLWSMISSNCKGQVDQWVEPYLRATVERLRRAEKSCLKCLLI